MLTRLVVSWAAVAVSVCGQDAARIRELTATVAGITGFSVKRATPVERITREAWKRWVDEEVKRTVKPEEIAADELTLKMFGLVAEDFDLRKSTVDLLGEQAAALYDHRRKRLLLVEGGEGGFEGDSILVHELAHALADQHYDMTRFLDRGAKTGEQQTARLAVVEGQAMWVMVEEQLKRLGSPSLKQNRAALEMMLPQMGQLAASSYPVFASAPLYLRETLVFPYTAGLLFQQAAVEKMGERAFGAVLKDPPKTTREVLHPEVWPGAEERAPELPDVGGKREVVSIAEGVLGELDVKILVKLHSEKDAAGVAGAWRAGAYELLRRKAGARPVLRWAVRFAGEEEARRFAAIYGKGLEKKSPPVEKESELVGKNARGRFRVEVEGAVVRGVEGL